jgi:hypothetical protein
MSTGDWFTLNPLNLKNYQTEIDQLNNNYTYLASKVDAFEFLMNNMQNQVDAIGTMVTNMSTQLTNLSNTVNGFSNTINNLSTSINNLTNLYQPVAWFDTPNVRFTDLAGDTVTGNVIGAWYRPIVLSQGGNNDGVDLKYILLVLRAITIGSMNTNVNYNSDPMPMPIPFVGNNTFNVFWSSSVYNVNRSMVTAQAEYSVYSVPPGQWALNVLPAGSSINNDSACFILMYI